MFIKKITPVVIQKSRTLAAITVTVEGIIGTERTEFTAEWSETFKQHVLRLRNPTRTIISISRYPINLQIVAIRRAKRRYLRQCIGYGIVALSLCSTAATTGLILLHALDVQWAVSLLGLLGVPK